MDFADDGDLGLKIAAQKELKDQDGNQVYFSEEQVLAWFA